jgi:hypothetical protein
MSTTRRFYAISRAYGRAGDSRTGERLCTYHRIPSAEALDARVAAPPTAREAAAWQKPLPVYAPDHPAVADLQRVALEVLHG